MVGSLSFEVIGHCPLVTAEVPFQLLHFAELGV